MDRVAPSVSGRQLELSVAETKGSAANSPGKRKQERDAAARRARRALREIGVLQSASMGPPRLGTWKLWQLKPKPGAILARAPLAASSIVIVSSGMGHL